VTGGGRGIGAATARAFAAAGARVVLGDLDLDVARATAAGIGAEAFALDVREASSFDAFTAAVGPVDVLVNNAGVAFDGPFLDTPPAMRALQLDVNLGGVVNGMAAVLPGMVARGRGHIVSVASLAGRLPTPNAAIYTATKHAVIGLTEAVRAEVRHKGVRVTAVLPTFVPTRMTEGLALQRIPTVPPERVAAAIVRMVRRGGPAVAAVPRWMGGLPRMTAFTPQFVQDRIRDRVSGASGRGRGAGLPDAEADAARVAYRDRLRDMIR